MGIRTNLINKYNFFAQIFFWNNLLTYITFIVCYLKHGLSWKHVFDFKSFFSFISDLKRKDKNNQCQLKSFSEKEEMINIWLLSSFSSILVVSVELFYTW
jgi:hypothetical protein